MSSADRQPALPPELRDSDEYESPAPSSTPPWVRITALLIIVAVLGAYVASYFFS